MNMNTTIIYCLFTEHEFPTVFGGADPQHDSSSHKWLVRNWTQGDLPYLMYCNNTKLVDD